MSKVAVSVVLGIVFFPLVSLLFFAMDSIFIKENIHNFVNIFNNKLLNSFVLSLSVSLLSTVLAFCSAILYYHKKSQKLRNISLFILVFLFGIAPVIYSSIFSEIKIFSTLDALIKSIVVLTLWLTPLASGIMILMMKNIDASSLISFKFLPISKYKVFQTIIVKQSYFSLFGTATLIFMMVFVQEEVPSFFGYRTYAEEFLSRIVLMEEFESTLVYAFPFMIFACISAVALYFILKKNRWDLFQDQITPLEQLNLMDSKFFSYMFILIIAVIVLFVLFTLLLKVDFSIAGTLLSENIFILLDSFVLSIFASAIATSISVYLVKCFYRTKQISKIIVLIAFLSLYWFLPSSLLGLTLLKLSQLLYIDSEIYEYGMLIYGYVLKVLPIGVLGILILSQHLSPSLVLKHLAVSKTSLFFKIVVPIEFKGWLMVFAILFFLLVNEITTTVLLVPAGFETIIVKIYNLMHYGDFETVAFLSLLQISLILFGLSLFTLSRDFYDKT